MTTLLPSTQAMTLRPTLLCWLFVLLAGLVPIHAQQLWSRTYARVGTEQIGSITCLRDGSVLLGGSRSSGTSAAAPYLVRTNANGDTLWTRRYSFLTGYASETVEDNAGRMLLCAADNQRRVAVLLARASGDTIWTRRLPNNGDYVTVSDFAADQTFVLAAYVQGHPTLLRLSASGQIVQQTTVDYSATEAGRPGFLARGIGGYWLHVYTGQTQANNKAVFVSEAGARGPEYALPMPSGGFLGFTAVENGNFVVLGWNSWYKVSPSFTSIWNQSLGFSSSSGASSLSGQQLRRNTNGEYVVLGSYLYSSHSEYSSLVSYNAQGTSGSVVNVLNYLAGTASSPYLRFAVSPANGDYYVAMDRVTAAPNGSDLVLMRFRGAAVTATTPATAWAGQLYPNPVGATETLHLTPAAPLAGALVLTDAQGRTVRQWPARPAAARYELPVQGLAAGLYQLHLTDQQGRPATLKVVKD
jgi:hypothetical protein